MEVAVTIVKRLGAVAGSRDRVQVWNISKTDVLSRSEAEFFAMAHETVCEVCCGSEDHPSTPAINNVPHTASKTPAAWPTRCPAGTTFSTKM
jgi:hypothetical protein